MDRAEAVQKLVQVFRQQGYEGTTLARISQATGLGKASLYHHFPGGKQEMAAAVLEYAGQWWGTTMLAPLQTDADPAERIRQMGDRLSQFYDCGRGACLLAIFTLGDSDDRFHTQVNQMLDAWITALAAVAMAAGIPATQARERAENVVIQVQGALVLTRGLGSTAPFERVIQQLAIELLRPLN